MPAPTPSSSPESTDTESSQPSQIARGRYRFGSRLARSWWKLLVLLLGLAAVGLLLELVG